MAVIERPGRPSLMRFTIDRDGGLVRLRLRGRIEPALFPQVARITAPAAGVGDLIDVDLRLTAEEAWKAGEMLQELSRQTERHVHALVVAPQG